jgi:hypothetical protein
MSYGIGEIAYQRYESEMELQAELRGEIPVYSFGWTFYLNKPHKYTIYSLLKKLDRQGEILINGVDDIIPNYSGRRNTISILKQVIKYAHHLEKQANLQEAV